MPPLAPALLLAALGCGSPGDAGPAPGPSADGGGADGGAGDGGLGDGGLGDGGLDGGAGDGGAADGGADTLTLVLPAAGHELAPLVCAASAPAALTWTVDGVAWTGDTETTTQAGDTIPPRALRAGQTWRCAAEGAAPVEATVAPYAHTVLVEPVDARPGEPVTIWYRGALLAIGPVHLDLGYDGWTDQGAVTPEVNHTELGGVEYVQRLVLDGEGRVDLTLPEGVSALHLSFWTEAEPAEDGDEEHLWGLTLPALGPWLTVDPDGGLVAHFLSTARGPATVDVAWDGGSLRVVDESTDELHHLRLDGVPAGVELSYTVTEANGRASPTWTTHRVAPEAEELVVVAAADMQDNGAAEQRWPEVAQAISATVPDADLLVLPGDLAGDDRPGLWWLYFHGGAELFAQVPQIVAVGNHDTPTRGSDPDTTSVLRYFDPRGDGPGPEIGRIAYGPLDVVLLNSEVPEEWAVEGAQYLWAEAGLARESDAAFTWVAFHRPAYDVGARFADEQDLFRPLTALFDGRVDLVLMGHEHIYQRFVPVRYDALAAPSGRYGRGSEDGVAYVVLPAAGNRGDFWDLVGPEDPGGALRPLLATPELEPDQVSVAPFHGYVEARITSEATALRTWAVGDEATEVEAFSIAR